MYGIYHDIYQDMYHMVYTIWNILLGLWYIPVGSGIYHDATFQLSSLRPQVHTVTTSSGFDLTRNSTPWAAASLAVALWQRLAAPDSERHLDNRLCHCSDELRLSQGRRIRTQNTELDHILPHLSSPSCQPESLWNATGTGSAIRCCQPEWQ